MKLLSWNIRQGGGTRVNAIIKATLAHSPHIVIFSEFRNNEKGNAIRNKLMAAGYLHQFVTAASAANNSVLIASQFHGESLLHYDSIDDFPQSVVQFNTSGLRIFGLYIPHKKKHKIFEFLLNEIKSGSPAIMAGDFNTGINGLDQKGKSFWYSEFLTKFEDNDYIDAFRHIHGNAEEYSWYSHGGNGFRYDHTWVHKDLNPLINGCYFSHKERENNLSDHSLMILELTAD